jgi:PAS domain S-box-containing protein
MPAKPTYQDLENQIIEIKRQNKIAQLNSDIQNEPIYHSLFENMSEGFARCQMLYENDKPIDFIYLEVNSAFEKLTGLKNIAGKRISEVIVNHKNENPELFNLYDRVSQTGISEKTETYVPPLNIWFSISVYSSQKGQFLVIFDNITERKKSEEKLKASEAQFRGLFTQSHIGTAIVGLDKCFVRINEAFCHFLGYSENEILGKTVADFTHPEDLGVGMNEMKRILEGEIEFATLQKRYLRKDGAVVWGELTISIVRDEQDKPLYFLPVIQDITVRYKAEKALKKSEARFQELIKNSFDIIVLLDSKGNQHFISESCEKILGYKQEELIGISVIEKMIHPEDQESTIKGFNDIVQNKTHGGTQYRHLHKNGGWVYLEAYGNNQLNNPEINAVILNVRDVTERKQAEQIIKENEIKLRELNSTKDKFFSIIAHDLRSPFNNIIGLSELLIGNEKEDHLAQCEKYADLINSSAKNTLVLLDNLLNWAKSQTCQSCFNPKETVLSSLISEAINTSRSRALLKNISLNIIETEKVEVYVDENMVMVILRNLISNAIKFTKPGGEININVIPGTKQVEVSISDNGVGMDEEKMKTLFKVSSNTTSRGTANEKGSGLGLVLCKEFVEKLNGKIWVESEKGKGSNFKFTLPTNKLND